MYLCFLKSTISELIFPFQSVLYQVIGNRHGAVGQNQSVSNSNIYSAY